MDPFEIHFRRMPEFRRRLSLTAMPLSPHFPIALERVRIGRSHKSVLPTALRGVGKTVLLNKFVSDARALGCVVAQFEASESDTFLALLATEVRTILFELSATTRIRDRISKALGTLKSFSATFGLTDLSLKLGVDAEAGKGDSGVLSTDVTALSSSRFTA